MVVAPSFDVSLLLLECLIILPSELLKSPNSDHRLFPPSTVRLLKLSANPGDASVVLNLLLPRVMRLRRVRLARSLSLITPLVAEDVGSEDDELKDEDELRCSAVNLPRGVLPSSPALNIFENRV